MNKLTVKDVNLVGKRVLFRADYNVPMITKVISDVSRITATFPTLKYLISQNIEKLVIVSHLGQPGGKPDPEYTLFPVFEMVRSFLKTMNADLKFCEMYDKQILENRFVFIENLRFNPGEDNVNSQDYTKYVNFLNKCGEILVIDAFGVLHRDCTSVVRVKMPVVAGFLVEKELQIVESILNPVLCDKAINQNICNSHRLKHKNTENRVDSKCISPGNLLEKKRIDLLLLGGKKVSDKVRFLKKLIPVCKEIFIFGAMCFPFIRQKGVQTGQSFCEAVDVKIIDEIMDLSKKHHTNIQLPCDFVCKSGSHSTHTQLHGSEGYDINTASSDEELRVFSKHDCVFSYKKYPNKTESIVDVGKKTISELRLSVDSAQTILWNGTPGIYEQAGSHLGTSRLIEMLMSGFPKKKVIVGGGDTAAAVSKFGEKERFFHISTGGGALIALLQGESLPGLNVISERSKK